jgi:hypothetical protein
MPRMPMPPRCSDRALVLDLLARDEFAEGELGLATPRGVVAIDVWLGAAPDCFLVRAVAEVKSGRFGRFVETIHKEE